MAKTVIALYPNPNTTMPLFVPKSGIILGVGMTTAGLTVWMEVDVQNSREIREFAVLKAGQPIPDDAKFVGLVINNGEAYFIYEKVRRAR